MGTSYRKNDSLIIEDDSGTVNLLKIFIESHGYTCKSA